MAEVLRYVNTASTAGGDGTTNNTTGATRAYATLNEWESNEGTNLITDGDTHRVLCSGGADSTAVTLNGLVSGASNFVTIEGEWDASTGRLDTSLYHLTSTASFQIINDVDYTVYDKMQFEGGGSALIGIGWGTAKNDGTAKNCVFHDFGQYGSRHNAGATGVTYFNNLYYDIGRSPVGSATTDTGLGTFYNCTAYDYNTTNAADASFVQPDANDQYKVINCIGIASSSSTRGDFEATYTLTTGSDYNASSDTSAPGANSIHSITDSTEFKSITGGSENFHLSAGSTLRGDGVGPSSDASVPTNDVDGDTRSGATTDIGFDLYVPVTRYVNTASTAGGDGTTNATTGATRAYATLSEWEADEGTNLTTDKDEHIVYCSGGADTTYVALNGFTTNSTYFVTIEGEWDASTGRFDSTKYNIAKTSGNQIDLTNQSYTVFDKMQFDGASTANHAVFMQASGTPTDTTFRNSCFYDIARTGTWQRSAITGTLHENNLFYDIGWACVGVDSTSTNRGELYNCTAYNYNTANQAGYAFTRQNANGQWKVVNCIGIASSSSTRGDFEPVYTLATGSDYNASSDTTAPGANSIHSITDTTEFVSVTGGSEDFHLDSGSTLLGDGVGPSTDASVPTTDVDGDARS